MKQTTLKEGFSLKGKGLHSGLDITAEFLPAPDNHGYKFQRVDVEGEPIIDALAENVKATTRGTVIGRGDVHISTIEHSLAALYAAGVDNCLIKVNGPEMPILDGSASDYANEILRVGTVEQDSEKDYYVVKQKIEVRDDTTGSSIVVLPDDEFSIDTMVAFDSPVLPNQFASLDNLSDFAAEIAPSRTFVFVREIEPLVKNNLIKGGDLENAIVIYDSPMEQTELDRIADLVNSPHKNVEAFGYLNERPLQHDNEPARHKLLDVLGDLALIGRPLKGKVIATRPGHSLNTTLAKQIRKELKRQELQAPVYNPNVEPLMDINRIRELLPHRYPFLLVDKIIDMGEKHIVGVKNVTGNEPYFQGHFPQEPVMPGVLMVEAMAQTGGLLVLSTVSEPERYSTYFMKIDNVKFRQKVVPGDTLIFHVSFMTEMRRGCAVMKGYAFVGERIVTECEFMAQIVKTNNTGNVNTSASGIYTPVGQNRRQCGNRSVCHHSRRCGDRRRITPMQPQRHHGRRPHRPQLHHLPRSRNSRHTAGSEIPRRKDSGHHRRQHRDTRMRDGEPRHGVQRTDRGWRQLPYNGIFTRGSRHYRGQQRHHRQLQPACRRSDCRRFRRGGRWIPRAPVLPYRRTRDASGRITCQ